MTTIAYASDLHLELLAHDNDASGILRSALVSNNSGVDAFVLVGDIIEARILEVSKESTKYGHKKNTLKMFKALSEAYPKVFYILGNHEHYRGTLQKTKGIIEEHTGHLENFFALENDTAEVNDVKIFGATFWTDAGGPANEWFVQQGMNDYKLIKTSVPNYRKLRAKDTVREHMISHTALREFLRKNKEEKMVVFTHHAPHINMVHERYRYGDDVLNHAYYTDQTELMAENDNLLAWISGHTHASIETEVFGTKTQSRTLGYYNHEISIDDLRSFKPGIITL